MLASFRSPAQAIECGAAAAQPGLFNRLLRAMALRRQQHALLRLDDDLLRDIGLTRDQAVREASRPFWDAPANWRG